MRHFLIAGIAVTFIAAGPVAACEYDAAETTPAQVANATPVDVKAAEAKSLELAAATDKDKKPAKKKVTKKKEKVEYMRSAAGPEPKPAKKKKTQ